MYDVIIIGAGPAGVSAGLHASARKLKTLVITKELAAPKDEDEFMLMDFPKLLLEFKKQLSSQKEYLELIDGQEVISLEKNIVSFSVETKEGKQYYSKSIVIATGHTSEDGNSGFETITLKDITGKIFVDADMQTNIPGIFAAGDITVTLAKGLASSMLEGARAALALDKILKSRDNIA
jgi:thioredoxin reductase